MCFSLLLYTFVALIEILKVLLKCYFYMILLLTYIVKNYGIEIFLIRKLRMYKQ
jgi:hypothetical protein